MQQRFPTRQHHLPDAKIPQGLPMTLQVGDPHLFVFHWVNWAPSCYSCGWQQWSSTYYPGMDLANLVGKPVYMGYVYYQGNWWGWFDGQWVPRRTLTCNVAAAAACFRCFLSTSFNIPRRSLSR